MNGFIARVKIEEGDDILPTIMKLQFSPEVWNFAFSMSQLNFLNRGLSKEEFKTEEVRQAIRKASYYLEKELMRAVREQLGVDLR